jgi:hypothetical protein
VEGYYATLSRFLATCRDEGFMSGPVLDLLISSSSAASLLGLLETQARSATAPDDYLRI